MLGAQVYMYFKLSAVVIICMVPSFFDIDF